MGIKDGGGMSGGIGGNAKKTTNDIASLTNYFSVGDVSGNIQNPTILNKGRGSVSLVMADYGSVQSSLAMANELGKSSVANAAAMNQKALDAMSEASKMAVNSVLSSATVDANRTKLMQFGIGVAALLVALLGLMSILKPSKSTKKKKGGN